MNGEAQPPALMTDGLSHVYRRGWGRSPVEALKDVSLRVEPGRVFGLLGPNGSGKSTLVKLCVGLLRPVRGDVTVVGHPAGSRESLRRLGYLPENVGLPRNLAGREVLDLYGALSGLPRPKRDERIASWLATFDMTEDGSRHVGEYSKGMVQKIGIIQALLHQPDVLFLDEPASGLDPRGRDALAGAIRETAKRGATVVLSSHVLSDVESLCTDVGILHRGRLLKAGPLEEVVRIRRAFDARLRSESDLSGPEIAERLTAAGLNPEEVKPAVRSLLEVFQELAEEEGP